jgi:hypothetical protein
MMKMNDERTKELVRLVERDYDQTTEFIHSVTGTISTTRGWTVTVWLALLGVAVQQSSAALALLAAVVLLPFGLLDLYHSWLYSEALNHARDLERLAAGYYAALEMGEDDEDLVLDFEERLGANNFGLYINLKQFQLPQIRAARPRLVFLYFYPGLFATALLAAFLLATVA